MIWGGGGGNFRNEFIFSWEPLPYKFFFLCRASQKLFFIFFFVSLARPSKFIFSQRTASKIFSSLKSASQNLFFPGECLSKFIFSWRVPLKIYFFPESASQNLFFPGEYLSKFIFSWRRASEIIFFSISSGPTPRSLMVVP